MKNIGRIMKNKEYRIYEEYRIIGKLFVKDEIWIALNFHCLIVVLYRYKRNVNGRKNRCFAKLENF